MTSKRFRNTALLASLIVPATVHAIDRTYLASDGNDAHPCTLTKPCRNLPAALAAVTSGGEVWMLDSGDYNTGTVTIGKSVTVLAVPGAVGGFVAAAGGAAVAITAADLTVAFRNVVFSAPIGGGASTGVNLTGASRLIVEESTFTGLTDRGVRVAGNGRARISGTNFRANRYAVSGFDGATIDIAGSVFSGNFLGVSVETGVASATATRATVSDSTLAYNDWGLAATTFGAASIASIDAARCSITNASEYALFVWAQAAGSQAIVSIGGSLVANNNYSHFHSGATGTINTFGNNQFLNNRTSFGPLTPVALQ